MLSQYFGSFLLNKGYIERDVLNDLLSQEKQAKVKIGVLAVSSGLLTADQVEEIHYIQKTKDKRFGEIAVELGYLADGALETLLLEQKSSQIELSQLLVDEGIVDLHTLEKAINEYKQESKLSYTQFRAIEGGNIDKLVEAFVNMPNSAYQQEYIDYISLFLRNIIRFIDSSPIFEVEERYITGGDDVAVQQSIQGLLNIETYVVFPANVYVAFAGRFAEMRITEKDDLADASVTEFLNLHNGIYVVNMSEKRKGMELLPPKTLSGSDVNADSSSIICSIDTDLGKFQLVLTSL
jgi:CheY-specific phosphatase CheX